MRPRNHDMQTAGGKPPGDCSPQTIDCAYSQYYGDIGHYSGSLK